MANVNPTTAAAIATLAQGGVVTYDWAYGIEATKRAFAAIKAEMPTAWIMRNKATGNYTVRGA